MRISDSLVEKLLIGAKKATEAQLKELHEQEKAEKKPLQDLAVQSSLISEKDLTKLYAAEIDIPFVEINTKELKRDVLQLIVQRSAGGGRDERTDELRHTPVSAVMHRAVYSIGTGASLCEAAHEMLRYGIGFLPVVVPTDAGSKMVGLITESDLLTAAYVPRFDGGTRERCTEDTRR